MRSGFEHSQGINALNSAQFISDESSAKLVLYLCKQIKSLPPTTVFLNTKKYLNNSN